MRSLRILLAALLLAATEVSADPTFVPQLGGQPQEIDQTRELAPAPRPAPAQDERFPCHFGPITKRIDLLQAKKIVDGTNPAKRRDAWQQILAMEDDPNLPPVRFMVAAQDDGLGDGLVCPPTE